MAAPGWATPELAEEWVEEGESGVEMSMASIVHEHGFAPGRASTIAEEDEEEEEEDGGWRDEFEDDEVEWPTAEEGDGMSFTNAHQTVVGASSALSPKIPANQNRQGNICGARVSGTATDTREDEGLFHAVEAGEHV